MLTMFDKQRVGVCVCVGGGGGEGVNPLML